MESFGSLAFLTVIWGFWQNIKSLLARGTEYVIEKHQTDDWVSYAIMGWLLHEHKPNRFAARFYDGALLFVRPVGRVITVALRRVPNGTTLYWIDGRPLWVVFNRSGSQHVGTQAAPGSTSSAGSGNTMAIRFIRGTFDSDELIQRAVDYANSRSSDVVHRRHRIVHVVGTVGKPMNFNNQGSGSDTASVATRDETNTVPTYSVLRWKPEDLIHEDPKVSAIERMALSPELCSLYRELVAWKQDEKWCTDHSVPWRFGIGLEGEAGTGKTAFIRAVAEDLDLPLFVFSLSTLFEDELQQNWRRMMANAPCVALFEDIDNVFHGRVAANEHIQLSFDALLNCIDGVEKAHGLLVALTTNKPEELDSALIRKNRIDRMVTMPRLDVAGRQKLAARILDEYPSLQAELVAGGDGMTGAMFQDLCVSKARELRIAAIADASR